MFGKLHTSADVVRAVVAAIRAEPACYGVYVDSVAYEDALFAHFV